jgi:hypothetical protein
MLSKMFVCPLPTATSDAQKRISRHNNNFIRGFALRSPDLASSRANMASKDCIHSLHSPKKLFAFFHFCNHPRCCCVCDTSYSIPGTLLLYKQINMMSTSTTVKIVVSMVAMAALFATHFSMSNVRTDTYCTRL